MDIRLEMGINKCRDMLSRGMVERNNGVMRIVGFMRFGEEVESSGAKIRGMEEGDI